MITFDPTSKVASVFWAKFGKYLCWPGRLFDNFIHIKNISLDLVRYGAIWSYFPQEFGKKDRKKVGWCDTDTTDNDWNKTKIIFHFNLFIFQFKLQSDFCISF